MVPGQSPTVSDRHLEECTWRIPVDVEALVVRLLRAFVLAATLLCAVQPHLSAEEKGRELFPAIDAAKSPQTANSSRGIPAELTFIDSIRGAAGGFRPT